MQNTLSTGQMENTLRQKRNGSTVVVPTAKSKQMLEKDTWFKLMVLFPPLTLAEESKTN